MGTIRALLVQMILFYAKKKFDLERKTILQKGVFILFAQKTHFPFYE
jgi:hypothetical protein